VKAAGDFQNAIQLNPNDVLAYNNAAVVFCKQGDYDKALLYLHNAIALIKKIKPSHADIFNNLGFVYMKKGMDKASAAAYKYARHIMQNKTADTSDNYNQIAIDQRIDGHPVTAKFYGE
jgi:Tfp pilus assembly protein PilF